MPGVSAMRVASSALSRRLAAIAIGGHARQLGIGLADFRLLDLAIDLEPPQLAEHGARLRGEPIGLRLQRANPLRGALGLRLRIRCRDVAEHSVHRAGGQGGTEARSLFASIHVL